MAKILPIKLASMTTTGKLTAFSVNLPVQKKIHLHGLSSRKADRKRAAAIGRAVAVRWLFMMN